MTTDNKIEEQIKQLGNELEEAKVPYLILAETDDQYLYSALLTPSAIELIVIQAIAKALISKEEEDKVRFIAGLGELLMKECPDAVTKIAMAQSPFEIN